MFRVHLALIVSPIFSLIYAQSSVGSGAISGVVMGPTQQVISGAEVKVENTETGQKRVLFTAENGRYLATALAVGAWQVEVSSTGFQAAFRKVELTVGATLTVDFQLQVGAVSTRIEVTDSAPMVSAAEAADTSVIGEKAVSNLPIRGRNFVEFAQLTPGVSQEGDRGGLVVAGQRSINSNVSVDGMDFNDSLQGNQRGGNDAVFFFPQLAIREFQMVRSGANAEIGRTNAGFMNAVTKSGSNQIHGEALYLNRSPQLTDTDAFGRTQDNRQQQFGGAIGGALVRDKLFYFGAIEQNFLRTPFFVKFDPQPANGPAVPADLQRLEGENTSTNDTTALFTRLDWNLSQKHTLNFNYLYSRLQGDNFGITSSQTNFAASIGYSNQRTSNSVKLSLQSILSTTVINELRFQWAQDNREESPNTVAPEIRIAGFGRIGGPQSRPQFLETGRFQWLDNVSGVSGRHNWKLGVDYNLSPQFQNRAQQYQGVYNFASLAAYLSRTIQRFQQAIPLNSESGAYRGTQHEAALYFTDQWQLSQSVQITGGVRWEGQWNPQPPNPNPRFPQTAVVPNDLAQWQPRLGLTWKPSFAPSGVLRMSSGIFAARTPATIFSRVFHDNGINVIGIDSNVARNILTLVPFPNGFTSVPPGVTGIIPRIFGMESGFRNPRSFQFAASWEQEIARNWSASIGYLRNSTWNLHRMLDRNLFPPVYDSTGLPVFPVNRPDPSIGILQINESSAHGTYDAMLLTVRRRMSNRFTLQSSYTMSVNYDDDSNERDFSRNLVLDPYNLKIQRGYSKQDIRHNAVVSGLVSLPYGFVFSSILQARSGLPYTAIVGADLQRDGNIVNDRAIIGGQVVPRNSFRQPSFFNWDTRILRDFRITENARITVSFEAFNITKASNKNFGPDQESLYGRGPNPDLNFGIPFEAPSSARFGGARQVQLGARFSF
jgi:hypothetical protein